MADRILRLSLKELPFNVMVTGEKRNEYRLPSHWIKSRLFNKDGTPKQYNFVEFTHGYGGHRPSFRCEFKGVLVSDSQFFKSYSNGLQVFVNTNDYIILLGDVVSIKNII